MITINSHTNNPNTKQRKQNTKKQDTSTSSFFFFVQYANVKSKARGKKPSSTSRDDRSQTTNVFCFVFSLSLFYLLCCDRVCRGVEYFFGIQIHHIVVCFFFISFTFSFLFNFISPYILVLSSFFFASSVPIWKFIYCLVVVISRLHCKQVKLACIHLIHSSFYADRFNPHTNTHSDKYIFFFVNYCCCFSLLFYMKTINRVQTIFK